MSIARLDYLLEQYRLNQLSDSERVELESALLASSCARAAFYQCCVAPSVTTAAGAALR
jgi:hypothetical protein